MEKEYHLYLTTAHCQESHSLNVCNSADLTKLADAIENIIKSMYVGNEQVWWFYHENYAREKAEEMVKPFANLLEPNSEITKRKYPFFHLGFIITNYPMWPDNKGGYERDFCI